MPRMVELGAWKKELCIMGFVLDMKTNAHCLRLALWSLRMEELSFFCLRVPCLSKCSLSLTH